MYYEGQSDLDLFQIMADEFTFLDNFEEGFFVSEYDFSLSPWFLANIWKTIKIL